MILIIGLIIAIAVGIYVGIGEYSFFSGLTAFMVLILGTLLLTAFFCSIAWGELEVDSTEQVEIHALVDNASYTGVVSGNVFLVRGYVNETLKYQYMYYAEGKGWAFEEVNASECYLNYLEDNSKPYLEIISHRHANDFLQWLTPYCGANTYRFFLPSNAEVIDDFVVDFN